MTQPTYTVPGLDLADAGTVIDALQMRLHALNDLHLTLKHIHWNVVGPNFVAVHEMLDPQIDDVRLMADAVAERIATLGGVPVGTPGALVAARTWEEYTLGKADAMTHLKALDAFLGTVIGGHREAVDATGDLDAVTEGIVLAQLEELEKYLWFVRAHLDR
ncbi:MAG: DNA starvation/stationary phase protection protein [Cellulomonadaceae bacterium]|nr:DNA starvation/stationary phase protection protein [Cellulomonadaceae bacterium]